MPSFIMSLSHLLSSDFMRCCLCCQHQLKMFQSLCIFLPWPHSTLPPKFLLLQLLVCCKSDQGAELVLTSASLFELFCWVFLFFFFFPWSGAVHSAAAGKNCAGTTERTMWSGLGGEAEVLLPDSSSLKTQLNCSAELPSAAWGMTVGDPIKVVPSLSSSPVTVPAGIAKSKGLSVLSFNQI